MAGPMLISCYLSEKFASIQNQETLRNLSRHICCTHNDQGSKTDRPSQTQDADDCDITCPDEPLKLSLLKTSSQLNFDTLVHPSSEGGDMGLGESIQNDDTSNCFLTIKCNSFGGGGSAFYIDGIRVISSAKYMELHNENTEYIATERGECIERSPAIYQKTFCCKQKMKSISIKFAGVKDDNESILLYGVNVFIKSMEAISKNSNRSGGINMETVKSLVDDLKLPIPDGAQSLMNVLEQSTKNKDGSMLNEFNSLIQNSSLSGLSSMMSLLTAMPTSRLKDDCFSTSRPTANYESANNVHISSDTSEGQTELTTKLKTCAHCGQPSPVADDLIVKHLDDLEERLTKKLEERLQEISCRLDNKLDNIINIISNKFGDESTQVENATSSMKAAIVMVRSKFPDVEHVSIATLQQWIDHGGAVLGGNDSDDIKRPVVILDTRPVDEYNVSHIVGAIRVEYDNVESSTLLKEIADVGNSISPGVTPVVVAYCSVGYRSSSVVAQLSEHISKNVKDEQHDACMSDQVKLYNLEGSLFQWGNEGRPMVDANSEQTRYVHPYNSMWGNLLNEDIRKDMPT